MAEDVKIFDGTNWKSLKGAEGPTVVSADVGNVAKLGTDGKLLVNPADLDSRFVNLTGDTMTGILYVERDGTTGAASIQPRAYSDGGNASIVFTKTRGTKAAQTPVLSGDYLGRINFNTITTAGATITSNMQCIANGAPTATGVDTRLSFVTSAASGATAEVVAFASDKINFRAPLVDLVRVNNGVSGVALEVTANTSSGNSANQGWGIQSKVDLVTKNTCCFNASNTGKGTEFNTCFQVDTTLPAGANNYSIYDNSPAQNYLRGFTGIGWTTPTSQLEVSGSTKLRGTLDVTGNITSAGTAHSFAASSIPASAIGGNFVTLSATGGRSNFAAVSEPYAVSVRYNAAGLPNYIGTASTGNFQVSAAGGGAILSITSTGNITSPGTAHSFAAKSIPASAINGVPAIKADDLTDVTVATPAAGQVLRWNGTAFVNAALNYSDLTGTAPSGGLTQADADTRYVNITGDTVTGDLILNGKVGVGVTPTSGFHVKTATIQLDGATSTNTITANAPSAFGGVGVIDSASIVMANATAATGSYTAVFARTRGTDTNPALPRVGDFAFRSEGPAPSQLGGDLSVAGNLIGERPYLALTGSRALALADRSANIVNVSTGATPVTITLPTHAAAPFPIGSRFDIFDLSSTSTTIVQASAGVSLNWNATLTGGAAAVAGGVGASLTLPGPLCQVTLIKTATDTWMVLS